MQPCIDIPSFERSSGNLALLSMVSKAFLDQLPSWRASFDKASETGDLKALRDLLHKMKGCCWALSAHEAATIFEEAERALKAGRFEDWPSKSAQLLALMARMEAEVTGLIQLPKDLSSA